MEYNESYFKAKSNAKARTVWLILIAIMTLSYGSETSQGLHSAKYYTTFLLMAWVPFFIGILILKINGKASSVYKEIVAVGYGSFYTYVILTTDSAIAFGYILPLTSMLILFKDRKYMIRCGIANEIIVIVHLVLHNMYGINPSIVLNDYYLQISTILLCYICYVVSIDHLNESDGALVNSIRDNLDRVVTTVGQVKGASSSIVDGVTVVRELADENRQGADSVVKSMEELTQNNDILYTKTMSSMDKTSDINMQVQNVAALIEKMVNLIQESIEHANLSAEELADVVTTTNTMADLSAHVEQVLENFKQDFDMVKEETGTIEGITFQTNLLALNASIEAARAGAAGKGFAVVAEQIRALSTETKTSSSEIQSALDRLAVISDKMLSSIGETLSLIQVTLDKITQTSESISLITSDSTQIEDHIHIIDTAIKDVESANKQLVSNMSQISDIVDTMTECITNSRDISSRIVSKYDESAVNINTMENTIQALMCELGVGGFMGIEDIKTGMKASAILKGTHGENVEYHGTIKTHNDNSITLELEKALPAVNSAIECDMLVTVGNVIYRWENAKIAADKKGSATTGVVTIMTRPQILNRRKYPRIDMNNHCTITVKGTDETFEGKLDNLSANGFAFLSKDRFFSNNKGKIVTVSIDNFDLPAHSVLEGQIIRCSDNDGVYIVGCQMPEDNYYIMEYVEQMIRTQKNNN